VVGVALVVFGAFVLVRFPDRPGGRLVWHGVEVSSVGAGFPLIVLGVVAIAIAARSLGPPAGSRIQPRANPESAARELLAAWERGDRKAAGTIADPGVVEKLFSAPSLRVNSEQLTCYPVGTGQADCQMPHPRGILSLRLIASDRGWWVERVEY
jgi:hypothetical protein